MRQSLLIMVFAALLVCTTSCRQESMSVSEIDLSMTELVLLHNKERMLENKNRKASDKLEQVVIDEDLTQRSQRWADRMAQRGVMSHSKIGGLYRIEGENVAAGYGETDQVMHAWMNSTGHRRNILTKSFSHIGAAYAVSRNGKVYWCVQFGGE